MVRIRIAMVYQWHNQSACGSVCAQYNECIVVRAKTFYCGGIDEIESILTVEKWGCLFLKNSANTENRWMKVGKVLRRAANLSTFMPFEAQRGLQKLGSKFYIYFRHGDVSSSCV